MSMKEWAALAQPEPQGPTDDGPTNQEIEEWADAAAQVPLEEMDPEVHGWRRCFKPDEFGETIRAALARFGRPAIEPVDDRIAELEAELERERLRLAACGVVAMADTPESASKARDIHQDFWSASLDDVIRQVDALMALRLAIEPVPVSERLPGPGEWVWHCYAKVRFWQHGQHRNGQFFVGNGPESFPATHWRPHWALPVPQQEGQP